MPAQQGEQGRRRYVAVRCEVAPDGQVTPLAVLWTPGVTYEITKIAHSEPWACMGSGRGRRFTVWLGGHMTSLFWDGRRWYVLARR